MDRLKCLIFSFYREDPLIKVALKPLLGCTISRGLGIIRIDCLDVEHLDELSNLIPYLRVPLGLLALGRTIVLQAPGSPERDFPVELPFHSDLFS